METPPRRGTVQSIERALEILEVAAHHGGSASLTQLAQDTALPNATLHRLANTLCQLGYLRQDNQRRYTLGPQLIPLGEAASQQVTTWATPSLEAIVAAIGESANLAALDHGNIVYIAQAQSRHAMRMFTEVGRRVSPHCTAVGKAILAHESDEFTLPLVRSMDLVRHTETTLATVPDFLAELERVRERGYALDEGELEVGVRCVAVRVPTPTLKLAVSVSAPAVRMDDARVQRAAGVLQKYSFEIAAALSPAGNY
ncbi:IclR family transcriptional regulator [Micrococcales bacterium 31B]|nr:IclR family transcriptional regulator [Micrococcales bacterium 31B]